MAVAREPKSKFTASVRNNLVTMLDQKAAQLKVNRSEAIEEAIELWLTRQAERDEEEYCSRVAEEMNTDARSWNATTTASFKRKRK